MGSAKAEVAFSKASIPCGEFDSGWRKRAYTFVQQDQEVSDYVKQINELNDDGHRVEDGEYMYLFIRMNGDEIAGAWGVQGTPHANRPAWVLYLRGWYAQ